MMIHPLLTCYDGVRLILEQGRMSQTKLVAVTETADAKTTARVAILTILVFWKLIEVLEIVQV